MDELSIPRDTPSESPEPRRPEGVAEEGTTVLVVDDERSNVESLEKIFLRESMRVLVAYDAKHALEQLRSHRVHVILTDLMMPGTTGLELLRAVKQVQPEVEVVLMTAFGSVEAAVNAMREGAYDFVEKPLKRMTIVKSVRKAAERGRLVAENRSLKDEIKLLTKREIIGSSPAWRRVIEVATQAAPSMATVLVLGESGTGKELLARAMHEHGPRPNGPFEVVDGGALVPNLVASELFGHERGAFTGADKRHIGAFERAAGGTLFLDEIGELSQDIQPMLLGALERRRFKRLGGSAEIPLDVRLVAATHRDLRQSINESRFRLDLYYRVAVVTLRVPSLRERLEDVVPLAVEMATRLGADPIRIDGLVGPEGRRALEAHRWPGNVRELRNVVESTLAMGELPALFEGPEGGGELALQEGIARLLPLPYGEARTQLVSAFEKRYLAALLERTQGNVAAAARSAQMDRSHLIDMLKRHGMR